MNAHCVTTMSYWVMTLDLATLEWVLLTVFKDCNLWSGDNWYHWMTWFKVVRYLVKAFSDVPDWLVLSKTLTMEGTYIKLSSPVNIPTNMEKKCFWKAQQPCWIKSWLNSCTGLVPESWAMFLPSVINWVYLSLADIILWYAMTFQVMFWTEILPCVTFFLKLTQPLHLRFVV